EPVNALDDLLWPPESWIGQRYYWGLIEALRRSEDLLPSLSLPPCFGVVTETAYGHQDHQQETICQLSLHIRQRQSEERNCAPIGPRVIKIQKWFLFDI
ncbi:hypothetical protein AMR44_02615, partial [Shewanella algae]